MELLSAKKNKVVLSDYNYQRDIENRLLMAEFSTLDLKVLEEILFSPLKVQIRKIAKNIEESEKEVTEILKKFSRTGLLTIEGDSVIVDKEMRKYYETEILSFDPDFKPDMDFLQRIFKKVPIHALPIWYAVPRTSNNIFDSLMEKYLATPQIFQRYLLEFHAGDPTLASIAQDVFRAPDFSLSAEAVMKKYSLSKEQFEELVLLLEFHFVCCLGYKKEGGRWKEVVTPFHEWKEYLSFLQKTTTPPISGELKIERLRSQDYAFVQDMATVLQAAKKQPVTLDLLGEKLGAEKAYVEWVVRKLKAIKLIEMSANQILPSEESQEWLEMRLENRALYLYRHPLNRICSVDLPPHLTQEKVIREAEKSILRVLNTGWVFFDDFIKGVLVPLNDHSAVTLKKVGKSWQYVLPQYSEQERELIYAIVFEWLFETGITAIGTCEGQSCFCVTPFGQSLYG